MQYLSRIPYHCVLLQVFRDRKWLGSISYSDGFMTYPSSSLITDDTPSSYSVRNCSRILMLYSVLFNLGTTLFLSIHLLALCHACCSLIGYATLALSVQSVVDSSLAECGWKIGGRLVAFSKCLRRGFSQITCKQLVDFSVLKQSDYELSSSMRVILTITRYWFAIAKEQRKLELKTILLDVTDTKCPLFNYLIVLGKLYLWNCRRNKSSFFPFL